MDGRTAEERREQVRQLLAAARTGHFIGCNCSQCTADVSGASVELRDPLLLVAKAFLSEIRPWREKYQYPRRACTRFAKAVFEAAMGRGIRCAYVAIRFENSEHGHAIVAFKTDYGLAYFEPQTGDQEYPAEGKPYSSILEGVPSGCPVSRIDTYWNDDTNQRFVECRRRDCRYVWLARWDVGHTSRCPVCDGYDVAFAEEEVL